MKQIKYITLAFALLTMLTTSCRKYVEVEQFSTKTLKSTSDYQLLMNYRPTFESSYILPMITTDDMATQNVNHQNSLSSEQKAAYVWATYYYSGTQGDVGWNNLYNQIYVCNEVLTGVMSSENGTQTAKLAVYAEALVQRAYAYLSLVNQYGEIYNPATAATQIGIPMPTTPDLYQPLNRKSLQVVYSQIIKDVEEAIPNLPNVGANNGHVAKVSAYALLSRCYLYMRNFQKAGEYADQALLIQSSLNNLADYVGKTSTFPTKLKDPEVLLSKTSAGQFRSEINPELIALFGTGDLRLTLFTSLNYSGIPGRAYIRGNFTFEGIYTGLNVPEVLLNRAEVYARAGDVTNTLSLLNKLRKARYSAAAYQDLVITDPAALLPAVINERRREFMGTGLRWFDQRRLNLDPGLAKVQTRTFAGQDYTLPIGSNRYIFPVNQTILDLNPEIQQSPR